MGFLATFLIFTLLSTIQIFDELSPSELEEVSEFIIWKDYVKGEQIVDRKDKSLSVCLVAKGSVVSTTFSFSGKEIAYQTLGQGEIFGEIAAIDGGNRTTDILCAEDCTIGVISQANFSQIIEKYPSVARQVMLRLVGIIRFLCGRVYEFSALGVKERIRAEIVRAARQSSQSGVDVEITDMPTHEEIANRITTHREAVTKEFSYLSKQGLIKKQGKTLIVPDVQALANLITEEI